MRHRFRRDRTNRFYIMSLLFNKRSLNPTQLRLMGARSPRRSLTLFQSPPMRYYIHCTGGSLRQDGITEHKKSTGNGLKWWAGLVQLTHSQSADTVRCRRRHIRYVFRVVSTGKKQQRSIPMNSPFHAIGCIPPRPIMSCRLPLQ